MNLFLNGRFVRAERAQVSVADRGFLYGDGLFETMRVCRGQPFRWHAHWCRLRRGAELLRLPVPYSSLQLRRHAVELLRRNGHDDGMLRVQVTRGPGAYGYSVRGAGPPTVVMASRPGSLPPANAPPRWRLITASIPVWAHDPLARVKSCNKLLWVLARTEAEARGADAALLLNSDGRVVEADSANVFWIEHGALCTPALSEGPLPGVVRADVMKLATKLGLTVVERAASVRVLRRSRGVFLTLSTLGLVEVAELDGVAIKPSPLVPRLAAAYGRLVATA